MSCGSSPDFIPSTMASAAAAAAERGEALALRLDAVSADRAVEKLLAGGCEPLARPFLVAHGKRAELDHDRGAAGALVDAVVAGDHLAQGLDRRQAKHDH